MERDKFSIGPFHQINFDHSIQTDASGSWGCGAFFFPHWFQYAWTTEWTPIDIMAKELVPIIISCAIWAPLLAHKEIQFQCDNQSLVSAINKGSSKDSMVMHLLRCLWFITASFDLNQHRLTAKIYTYILYGYVYCIQPSKLLYTFS